jgi:hypothetical protein
VFEQCRLADARLAYQREHAALAGPCLGQDAVDRKSLWFPPE